MSTVLPVQRCLSALHFAKVERTLRFDVGGTVYARAGWGVCCGMLLHRVLLLLLLLLPTLLFVAVSSPVCGVCWHCVTSPSIACAGPRSPA